MQNRRHENYFAYRSFQKEFDAMRQFSEAGFCLFTVFPANTANSLGEPYSSYDPIWLGVDSYDFSSFDRQLEDIVAINSRAEFLCMVDLNSPLWLSRRLSCSNQRGGDSFSYLTDAVTNSRWREITGRYVSAFIDYAEKKHGKRIRAYIPVCGTTDEWMDYSGGNETFQKLQAYQKWSEENHLGVPRCIPCYRDRFDAPHCENHLRDPQVNADALQYWKFHSQIVAESIIDFASLIKQHLLTPKDVGVFYGYINQLTSRRLVQCGHLAYEKVLASPAVDFMISPGSYDDRPMGGGGGFMLPNGSVHCHGKRYLHECDHRTHASRKILWETVWRNEKEDIAGIRREFARSLIHGASLWMFDMWGGSYQGENVMAALRRCREIWEDHDDDKREPVSEIMMIVDPESVLYVNDQTDDFAEKIHLPLIRILNRLGTPYSVYSLRDLPRIKDLQRFKLFIFPALYELTPDKESLLRQYVLRDKKHVLWIYRSGVSDGTVWDVKGMERLTGFAPGSAGGSVKMEAGWVSHYIPGYESQSPVLLKNIAKEAGVHFYVEENIPVFASEDLLMVHSAVKAKLRIALPRPCSRITELFSGKTIASDADSFIYEAEGPDTLLFHLQ